MTEIVTSEMDLKKTT